MNVMVKTTATPKPRVIILLVLTTAHAMMDTKAMVHTVKVHMKYFFVFITMPVSLLRFHELKLCLHTACDFDFAM
jgi:hypothetical protein